MHFYVYLVGLLTLCLQYCAMTNPLDEFKVRLVNYIIDCSAEFPISTADIMSLKQKEMPNDMNVKCLLACAYQKIGMMDDSGKLSIAGIKNIAVELFADQPELRKTSDEFAEACKYVNDVEINGDKNECERARMIYKCSMESSIKFDLAT